MDPNADLYALKMRASLGGAHVSGAERILPASALADAAAELTNRALHHPKARPDSLNLKVELLDPARVRVVDALTVVNNPAGIPARAAALAEIAALTSCGDAVWNHLTTVTGLRGAMLVSARTGERLEPDHQRGVRASYMDALNPRGATATAAKAHSSEAQILAAKVVRHPLILAELCISDDPDYTTGYVATAERYLRIADMKPSSSTIGTRVFLVDDRDGELSAGELTELIDYLERQPVLVRERACD